MCHVNSLKKYIRKKNPKCSTFFQSLETRDIWYHNKPPGKNTLGKMILSKAAHLLHVYTHHCVIVTSITALYTSIQLSTADMTEQFSVDNSLDNRKQTIFTNKLYINTSTLNNPTSCTVSGIRLTGIPLEY